MEIRHVRDVATFGLANAFLMTTPIPNSVPAVGYQVADGKGVKLEL
ncbi:MAG: hypothetical protein Q8P00_03445 [Dehalococcoidia bacterium]|nr:hypothetical protein [Dehalococcoidia bacterium]